MYTKCCHVAYTWDDKQLNLQMFKHKSSNFFHVIYLSIGSVWSDSADLWWLQGQTQVSLTLECDYLLKHARLYRVNHNCIWGGSSLRMKLCVEHACLCHQHSEQCADLINQMSKEIGKVNIYDIYTPCFNNLPPGAKGTVFRARYIYRIYFPLEHYKSV